MAKILNITNGDCAADIMRQANIESAILPWRDALHEGSVPDLPLGDLTTLRAEYIANRGWGSVATIKQSFLKRDKELMRYQSLRLLKKAGCLISLCRLIQGIIAKNRIREHSCWNSIKTR